ncbi:electron transfer flavoprotein subunit beta/FixA family protein [Uliginosibacterium gangwonense]|uniref:electron transfer flavoprotein subunit beta/FixA family protein n=1 Tax=Uliginosibacterium gangwonense TaxID=392736 RepID=UPI00047716FB|nr:electron transfer flavoprotein subunit beta/FixA family protein [Uliginosibacterium gangwonense]
MKVLVPVKRVLDPNIKVRWRADGQGLDLAGQKMCMNPFDEVALEEAVRLKERGQADEVVVVTCGEAVCQDVLRHALALGADRAVLVESDAALEPLAVASVLRAVAQREAADLVLCGKQAIDDDAAQVGPMLAAMLGWPQACFATRLECEADRLIVECALDGCTDTLSVSLPALVSAELHLNQPRYASLVNVMKARRAPIETLLARDLGLDLAPRIPQIACAEPPSRDAVRILSSVAELDEALRQKGVLAEGCA